MVLLSLKGGLRAIEIAGLKWGAVREEDTLLELVTTKGSKPRTVPINRELRAALQAYRAESVGPAMTTMLSRPARQAR